MVETINYLNHINPLMNYLNVLMRLANKTLMLLFILITSMNTLENVEPINNFIYNGWDKGNIGIYRGVIPGLSVVFISGFCDKTFIMNMIYASINPLYEAFLVSLTVSELMNLASLFLGKVLPYLVSPNVIDWAAIILFAFFGFGLLSQGIMMPSTKLSNEIQVINKDKNIIEIKEEDGSVIQPLLKLKIESEQEGNKISQKEKDVDSDRELGVFDTWWKYSLAYMVGELGDKSQIATIVITAKYNIIGVFIGTALAQLLLVVTSLCLGKTIAVLLTNKQISIISAMVFLCFSLIYLLHKLLIKEDQFI